MVNHIFKVKVVNNNLIKGGGTKYLTEIHKKPLIELKCFFLSGNTLKIHLISLDFSPFLYKTEKNSQEPKY